MTWQEFQQSLQSGEPPEMSVYLQALWYDGIDDWEEAHTIIQDIEDAKAAWIHAYLHRKEGDVWNADYWYSRAGKIRPVVSLEQEWADIVQALL